MRVLKAYEPAAAVRVSEIGKEFHRASLYFSFLETTEIYTVDKKLEKPFAVWSAIWDGA